VYNGENWNPEETRDVTVVRVASERAPRNLAWWKTPGAAPTVAPVRWMLAGVAGPGLLECLPGECRL